MHAPLQQPAYLAPADRPSAGWWHLAPRHAVSLLPKAPCVLRIAQGRVWVTTGAHLGGGDQPDSGDVVLHAGDELAVPAGARLVMESWPVQPGEVVRFDFSEPVAAWAAPLPRFEREVARPARELGHELLSSVGALGRAAWAFARVLRGLAGYGEYLVAGRGRVLSALESGPP